MKFFKTIYATPPIVLTVVAIFGASTAFAEDRNDDDRKAAAMARTSVALSDPSAMAKGKVDGTLVKAGLEEEEDKLIYEVKIRDVDGKIFRFFLDPGSGEIIETSSEGLIELAYKMVFDNDDKQQLDNVRTAKVHLSRAVALAEQASGGRAFAASVENENGKVVYEVQLAKNGRIETVNIDPQSGQVTKLVDEEKSEHGKRDEHEDEREHDK